MRIVRYEKDDVERLGALVADGKVTPLPWKSLAALYGEEDPIAAVRGVTVDPDSAEVADRLLPPLSATGQVIGTGANYSAHADEARAHINTSQPIFFPFLRSAVIGPDDEIVIPTADTFTDYEVEFSAVIGRTARRVSEREASDFILGYTIVNDVTARDVVVAEKFQLMLGKSPDTYLPVGPAIVTADEIPDPYSLRVSTRLNGELRQDSNTNAMTARAPALIAAITKYVTLHPGDIVTTGTPGGTGFHRDPPETMRPGDTIEAEVEGVGVLANRLVAGW